MNNNIVQFKYGQGEIVSKLSNDQKETEISSDYRHYLMVDLPCFVRTLPSALAMLGLPSIESVSNNSYECTNNQEHSSVSSLVNCSKSLQFRFPDSKDPFRHELQTNLHQQGPSIRNGLLVRLKRNKRTGKITTEILGGVSKGFSFEQPADYHVNTYMTVHLYFVGYSPLLIIFYVSQFLPSSTGILPATTNLPDETTTERNSAERSLPTILLETLPESFSRSNVNKLQILSMTDGLTYLNLQPNIDVENSQHIDKPTNDDLNADEDAENNNLKRRKVRFVTTPFVGFGTPLRFENPKGPHPLRWKNCPPSHKGLQMIQLLKSIFELIPGNIVVVCSKKRPEFIVSSMMELLSF